MSERTPQYYVEIKRSSKSFKVDQTLIENLKKSLSSKMITAMKKEYVNCPVSKQEVVFLVCFNCTSYIRRVKGVVHCEGKEFSLKEIY